VTEPMSFAEKCRYWREHGLQVAARGITPSYRESVTTAPDGHVVRELRETETNASVYHHSNDDSRQDVTHRPEPITVHTDIPVDRIKLGAS
jgi:hypothetical protein